MSRFIESVRFEKGKYHLLDMHQDRINRTYKKFFPFHIPFNLESYLPVLNFNEKYKVRVVYSDEFVDVEFGEYVPRKVRSLRIMEDDDIRYDFKYEARDPLVQLFAQREAADDILIIKNGQVTDSSYANLVFWDGSKWYTPKTYLLNGVKRQFYLRHGLILEMNISLAKIRNFEKVGLINAMLDLGEVEVKVEDVMG